MSTAANKVDLWRVIWARTRVKGRSKQIVVVEEE